MSDTPLTEARCGPFNLRYAYVLSAESRASEQTGQDYLESYVAGEVCAFAVCDGVGQAFHGDLAARYLGAAMIRVLWDAAGSGDLLSQTYASALMKARLEALTHECQAMVKQEQIPVSISPMVRELLEEKRDSGTETTIVCGLVDLRPGSPARILVASLGDTRVRISRGTEMLLPLHVPPLGERPGRWSSVSGVVGGPVEVWFSEVGDPIGIRIQAYTDGFHQLDGCSGFIERKDLEQLQDSLRRSDTNDDASYLEIWIGEVGLRSSRGPDTLDSAVALLSRWWKSLRASR